MPTKAEKLAEAKRGLIAQAKANVARKKAAAAAKKGGAKKAAAPTKPAPTKGITNIIRKRATQASRVGAKARRGR